MRKRSLSVARSRAACLEIQWRKRAVKSKPKRIFRRESKPSHEGDFAQAAANYQSAVKLLPEVAELYVNLGLALLSGKGL